MTDLIDLADAAAIARLQLAYRNAMHGQRRAAYKRLQNEVHAQLRRAVGK